MRIKSQFIVTMVLFAVILVIVAASAIKTNQQREKVGAQERIAAGIAQGASELGYLSNDYLLYRESQQLARWQSRFVAFSGRVAVLQSDAPEQQALIANIQTNKDRMKAVFDSAASAVPERLPANQGAVRNMAFIQVSWSRMAVQTQALIADASRLSQLLHHQMDLLANTRTTLMYVLMGLFGAFLLASYWLTYRRILKSITELRAGAAVIGSGNLDFTIEERKNDEIGELSRAFNRMTTDLKAVTASKADLEWEIDERKRAEATTQRLNEDLIIKNQQLMSVNQELESFIYSLSHDLRQPLRAIASFSQIVKKSPHTGLREKEKGYLTRIIDNATRMGDIIESMLKLSRISRQEITPVEIDITRMAETVVSEIREAQPERYVDITIEAGLTAIADKGLMAAVLENLIGNAWKFTAMTENARIEFGAMDRDNHLVYYIRDNGAGFNPEYAKYLFKPFHRLHSETEFEGTGIGLSTVARCINRHGGRVWAEGGIGKGATVFFTLPHRNKQ